MNDTLGHEIERWWPHLSIEAKHRLLNDLDGEIDEATSAEIEEIVGGPVDTSLSRSDRDFIRTQVEAVD
jgi:hypothetical protein